MTCLNSQDILGTPSESLHHDAVEDSSKYNEHDQTQDDHTKDLMNANLNFPVCLRESQESHYEGNSESDGTTNPMYPHGVAPAASSLQVPVGEELDKAKDTPCSPHQ